VVEVVETNLQPQQGREEVEVEEQVIVLNK
jgi:hypothetical protein